jgi:hypothetical protein
VDVACAGVYSLRLGKVSAQLPHVEHAGGLILFEDRLDSPDISGSHIRLFKLRNMGQDVHWIDISRLRVALMLLLFHGTG